MSIRSGTGLALGFTLFLIPLFAFASDKLQVYTDLWKNASIVVLGKAVDVPPATALSGLPLVRFRIEHIWKGPGLSDVSFSVVQDDWDQPITQGGEYVIYADLRHADHPLLRITALDRTPEFTLFLFMEAGFFLACLFLVKTFSSLYGLRALPSESALGGFVGLIVAGVLHVTFAGRWTLPDWLPLFSQLALLPLLITLGVIVGEIVGHRMATPSMNGILNRQVFRIGTLAAFITLIFLIDIFADPFSAILISAMGIVLSDNWRSRMKRQDDVIQKTWKRVPLTFVSVSFLGFFLTMGFLAVRLGR